MKIVFFIPSLGSGGAERVVSVLASEFSDHSHDVHVAMVANKNLNYHLADEVSVHYLECEQDQRLKPLKRFLTRLNKIRKLVKFLAPDVVISFMAETNIDVCLALTGVRVPVIVSERNDPAIDPASRGKQRLRKLAYLRPAYFVFQTPDAQAYFSKRIQNKSSIILNPLSSNLPRPFKGERELRIISVGRLHPQKNYPLLLNAFSSFIQEYPEYNLEIYGDGPLEQQIREMSLEMGIEEKVSFKGFCKDVHQRIVNSAMFVMTSDYEGMPNALLEAMAMGIPCISTDCPCGGPRMLIQSDVNGQLVPVHCEESLVQAMKNYARHPERAKEMGMRACGIAEMAETKAVVKQWESCMNKAIEMN